jgi:molybdopterin-guanine dinucleotide biosynthesis protein A
MGRDKASLTFGGESLLDRVLRHVRQGADEIVLAAAAGQPRRDDVRVVQDASPAAGPLPAMLGALEGLDSTHVFVVACDAPLLQPALIPLLTALCAGWDAAVPVVDGRRMATCAVYRVAALRDAQARFGDPRHRSLQEFLQGLRVREVTTDVLRTADPDLVSFTPCNTPVEYARALRLADIAVNDGGPRTV